MVDTVVRRPVEAKSILWRVRSISPYQVLANGQHMGNELAVIVRPSQIQCSPYVFNRDDQIMPLCRRANVLKGHNAIILVQESSRYSLPVSDTAEHAGVLLFPAAYSRHLIVTMHSCTVGD